MHSSNGFTRRLEIPVRYPALPLLADGLIAACGCVSVVLATGPVSWWPVLAALAVAAPVWRARLRRPLEQGPQEIGFTANSGWYARCAQRPARPARLAGAWLAGSLGGLLLQLDDGSRFRVYLRAGDLAPDTWRRLRVRLRLPHEPGLT